MSDRALPALLLEAAPDARLAVSAVVVNCNGGERVLRALDALTRQRHPLSEILVVDNASTDDSASRIRAGFPLVRIAMLDRNAGLAAARNLGLESVRTPLVLLVDHDIYVGDAAVEAMARAYAEEQPTVVCPRIRLLPEADVVQFEGAATHFVGTMILRNGYQAVDATPARPSWVDGCPGACMLVDRARVLAAGGFDPLFFFYLEDLEFSLRLRGRGHRFFCAAGAEVFHERAAGTPGLSYRGAGPYPVRRAYLTMRHRLLTVLIHYRLRTLLVLLPALGLYEIASALTAARRGWLGAWARAWLWQLRNLDIIAVRRRRSQRARTVPDRDLLQGGPPPLAPGFLRTPAERRLFALVSRAINGYWSLARRWIA